MLEMQQIPPQEQGYSQLFLSGQTNNKINSNCPFYYQFSSLFDQHYCGFLKLSFPFNFNVEESHEGDEDVVEENDLEYDTKL